MTYAHVLDPRTGRPVQGVLSVAVLSPTATAGDALDNVLYVLGPEAGRPHVERVPGAEALVFLPRAGGGWTLVRLGP